jgi:hypothetical protein
MSELRLWPKGYRPHETKIRKQDDSGNYVEVVRLDDDKSQGLTIDDVWYRKKELDRKNGVKFFACWFNHHESDSAKCIGCQNEISQGIHFYDKTVEDHISKYACCKKCSGLEPRYFQQLPDFVR